MDSIQIPHLHINKSADSEVRNKIPHSRRHDGSNKRFIQSSRCHRGKSHKQNSVQKPYTTAPSTKKKPQEGLHPIINDFTSIGLQSNSSQNKHQQSRNLQQDYLCLNPTYLSNNIVPPNN